MIKKAAKEEEVLTLFWQHGDMFIRDLLNYYEDPKPHYNTVGDPGISFLPGTSLG